MSELYNNIAIGGVFALILAVLAIVIIVFCVLKGSTADYRYYVIIIVNVVLCHVKCVVKRHCSWQHIQMYTVIHQMLTS